MAYFQWADDMVIDNGPIDQDHRKLVEQVNALHTATTEGRGQEVVGALLEALIHDTVQHIQREEQQMAALGYPHLEQHQKGHALFVADLTACAPSTKAGALPWRRSSRRCCATGCRCTSGATTRRWWVSSGKKTARAGQWRIRGARLRY